MIFHQSRILGSVTLPVTAAAAAVRGLASMVRAPGPCRPSKFRFEVATASFPSGILSSFMARQAEQPGCLSLKPAASKGCSNPLFMACSSTCFDPGTIHAVTCSAFFFLSQTLLPPEVFNSAIGTAANKNIIHLLSRQWERRLQNPMYARDFL